MRFDNRICGLAFTLYSDLKPGKEHSIYQLLFFIVKLTIIINIIMAMYFGSLKKLLLRKTMWNNESYNSKFSPKQVNNIIIIDISSN